MATNPTQQAYDNWQAAKTPWYRQATPTSLAKEREAEQAYTNALRNPQSPVKFGGHPGAGLAASAAEPSTVAAPASPKQPLATLAGEPSAAAGASAPDTAPAAPSNPIIEASRQQDWSRQGMTNAQVAQANPEGRVQFERQPNGVASFSGSNVSGPVSYTNGAGTPLAGAGIDGRGFGGFDSAPAGAKVAIGEGGYAFGSSAAPSAAATPSQSPVGMSPQAAQAAGLVGERIGYNPAYDQRLNGGGQPSVQNMAAGFRAPTVAHSGNDFAARKRLENMATAASSITNTERWGGKGASRNPAVQAYEAAVKADLQAQGLQPDVDTKVMGFNANLMREQMSQDGATQRTFMQEAGADRRDGRRSLVEMARLGMDQETQAPQNRTRGLIASLQQQIATEPDTERRSSLVQRMRDIEGKGADVDPYLVVPGGQQTNSEGQVYTAPSSVFNRRSGTYLQQPGAQAKAAPTAGTVMGGYRFKGGNPADQANWEAI